MIGSCGTVYCLTNQQNISTTINAIWQTSCRIKLTILKISTDIDFQQLLKKTENANYVQISNCVVI